MSPRIHQQASQPASQTRTLNGYSSAALAAPGDATAAAAAPAAGSKADPRISPNDSRRVLVSDKAVPLPGRRGGVRDATTEEHAVKASDDGDRVAAAQASARNSEACLIVAAAP